MFVRICLLSVLLMGALAAPAASEDRETTKWSQVGGWHIRVDLAKDSCYAQQGYEDGTWLRIGFNMKNRAVYFALGNDNWRSLEAGKVYPAKFVFDDQKIYDSQLAAFAWGDRVVLGHTNVGAEFVGDFMEKAGLRIYYRGPQMVHLSLRDSHDALHQLIDCQKAMMEAGGSSKPGVRPAGDPFAQ